MWAATYLTTVSHPPDCRWYPVTLEIYGHPRPFSEKVCLVPNDHCGQIQFHVICFTILISFKITISVLLFTCSSSADLHGVTCRVSAFRVSLIATSAKHSQNQTNPWRQQHFAKAAQKKKKKRVNWRADDSKHGWAHFLWLPLNERKIA